jgi:hypothetical protein
MNARRARRLFTAVGATIALTLSASLSVSHADSATNAFVSTQSASRQFVVYAHDRLVTSALCVYAEHVKRGWLRLLGTPDNWTDPILLVVRPGDPSEPNAPAISLVTFQTDKHLKYQVDCLVPPPLDETKLLTTLIEALCAEWTNRGQPTVHGQPYTVPQMPPWLVQGMAASIQGRGDILLAAGRRSVAAGRPQSVTDLFNVRELAVDPVERLLFRANAWMFTDSLLSLPDGALKLRTFLAELGAQKVVSNAFWAVYREEFPQDSALEKWWSLQQASRTSFVVAENLSAQESAQRLHKILLTELGPERGYRGQPGSGEATIDQLWHYCSEAWLEDVLQTKINELSMLRGRAHPVYHAAIDDYLEALRSLMRQSTVRFRRAVKRAEGERRAAEKQTKAIGAYMDQAERVYAPDDFSTVVTGYFRTLDQVQKLEDERRNPISDYLDKFERQ